ncbi:DUF2164 family protein [Candidatus Uhrbacteria bacterium]|nr:DUF2164 family protein [Candidatus Uhrbacteria bacterium]
MEIINTNYVRQKNKFDFESEEQKIKCLNHVIGFFQDERSEKIGLVAAEKIFEFFLEMIGEEIYKKALKDCKKLLKEKFDDLEVELDLLLPKT